MLHSLAQGCVSLAGPREMEKKFKNLNAFSRPRAYISRPACQCTPKIGWVEV